MSTFTTDQIGRVVIINLHKGEDILNSIVSELQKLDVKNGVLVSAIGSLRQGSIHFITTTEDNATNEFITIEKPLELASAQGLVIDGQPHFHVTLSAPDGSLYAGHMEPGCIVQYLAELVVLEIKDDSFRRYVDEFNISFITKD